MPPRGQAGVRRGSLTLNILLCKYYSVARAALTEEAIDAFRARAVAAATRRFAEKGFEGVTMRAIATSLGVSPMTAYRYFAGKDELFAMVRREAFRRFADSQAAA